MDKDKEINRLEYLKKIIDQMICEIRQKEEICYDKVLEVDFLRWLHVIGIRKKNILEVAKKNIFIADLKVPICRKIYYTMCSQNQCCDLLEIAQELVGEEDANQTIIEILRKKINRERDLEMFKETIQRILERNWMECREEIKTKIQSGNYNEEQIYTMVKQFDNLKRNPPKTIGFI